MNHPPTLPDDATPWNGKPGWYLCHDGGSFYLTNGVVRTNTYITPSAAARAADDPAGVIPVAEYARQCSQRIHEYRVPAGAVVSRCKSCRAPIVWARTAEGRPIPLSVKTVQRHDGAAWALPHFSDCPHARAWSRATQPSLPATSTRKDTPRPPTRTKQPRTD